MPDAAPAELMTAYYNENDPKAAAWLRELIKQGHIADGEVDDRSIEDVRPSDLTAFTQCHFFAGIGGWSYALRLADWPDDRAVWTGSCPCQPFSAAGKGKGFADERHLWPAWFHLISECQPHRVFGEQVANALGWLDLVSTDLEAKGYSVGASIVGAHSVGAPHIRQRLYWVANSDSLQREQSARSGSRSDETQSGRPCGESTGSSDTRRMADSNSAGLSVERSARLLNAERAPQRDYVDGRSAVVELAESESEQSHGRGDARGGRRELADDGELGNATSDGRQQRRTESDGRSPVGSSVMVNSDDSRSQGRSERRDGTDERPTWPPGVAYEWLPCRDGKSRPVEPGTFPLAHGVPGRVGLLRGYGNAIVPQVAAAFIQAHGALI